MDGRGNKNKKLLNFPFLRDTMIGWYSRLQYVDYGMIYSWMIIRSFIAYSSFFLHLIQSSSLLSRPMLLPNFILLVPPYFALRPVLFAICRIISTQRVRGRSEEGCCPSVAQYPQKREISYSQGWVFMFFPPFALEPHLQTIDRGD